jgi:hypothetical protein
MYLKGIIKSQPKAINPVIARTVDEAMLLLENENVDGILLVKDKGKIDELTTKQKKQFAFVVL